MDEGTHRQGDYKQAQADLKAAKARAKALRPWYKKKRWYAASAAGFIVLVGVLGSFAPKPEDGPPATVSNSGGRPALAAATTTRTAAPVAQTAASTVEPTPEPTREPTPTPTAVCPSPTEQRYIASMLEPFEMSAEAFEAIGRDFIAAGSDITLLFDQDWQIRVAVALTMLNMAASDMRAASPPPSMADFHGDVSTVADNLDEMVELITDGIDEFDVAKLERATGLLQETNVMIVGLTNDLATFCD